MAVEFLLDAENGSLAFQKEQDFPDWSNSVYAADVEPGGSTDWSNDPASIDEAGRVLDVRNVRRAVIIIKISGSDSYDFTVKAGAASSNISGFYTLDGGVYTGQSGNLYIGVDCLGIDYLALVINAVSGTNIVHAELAPIPYE